MIMPFFEYGVFINNSFFFNTAFCFNYCYFCRFFAQRKSYLLLSKLKTRYHIRFANEAWNDVKLNAIAHFMY